MHQFFFVPIFDPSSELGFVIHGAFFALQNSVVHDAFSRVNQHGAILMIAVVEEGAGNWT